VGLGRQLVVARLPPVADHRPDDQPLDDDEDHDGEAEDDVVEVPDLLALDRLRLGREEAVPDRGAVQDDEADRHDREDREHQPADDRER
jgi:hypothetical protein